MRARAPGPRGRTAGGVSPHQELHELVLSNISDAVFITDEVGRFTYICPNVHTIFGYPIGEVTAMGNIQGVLGDFVFDRARLDAEGELANLERQVRDKGGDEHVVLVNVKRVRIEDGTLLFTCRDVTERKKMEEALRRSESRLRELGRQLVSAQEEERARVSRELHDEAGQSLTALKIQLELLQAELPPGVQELGARLRDAVALVESTMDRVRSLAQDLRPPALDTLGLNRTLEGFCRTFERRTKLPVEYTGVEFPPLRDASQVCLYRFLQEALTNAVKHAHARRVRVRLACGEGTARLSVEDDGIGFDVATVLGGPEGMGGLGLAGMRERLELLDGRIEIRSALGLGTSMVAVVPAAVGGGSPEGRGSRLEAREEGGA
ncbi:MAG: PAS domain-containing sensor histidine kinase [Deferrisomatales bacterium]|nr:PAS domain-containing sensor histidine kinase [Deferrisomatales bacterium]